MALERARATAYRPAVPGHGPVPEHWQLEALIDLNLGLARRVADAVLDLVAAPQSAEAILPGLMQRIGAPVVDAPSFYHLQPTVFAFLSFLHREGLVAHQVSDGRSLWPRT